MPICEKVTFKIKVDGEIGNDIVIHATDKEHKNLGLIISQYIEYPKEEVGYKFVGYYHIENYHVTDYWGENEISEEGYKYTISDMIYENGELSINEVYTFLYDPISPETEKPWEFKCPPPKEGFELVGYTHVKNFKVVEMWGKSTPGPGGYLYIDSKTVVKDYELESDEIIGCVYDPIGEPEKKEDGTEFTCPSPKEGYELVGFTYVKDFTVISMWGKSTPSEDGYIYIKSKTKAKNYELESDEIWSCVYEPIGWKKPDLTIKLIIDQPAPRVGDTVFVTTVVSNEGEGDVLDPFITDFLVDGKTVDSKDCHKKLKPGESVIFNFQTIFTEPGEHTIKVVADNMDTVVESNEDNNEEETSITVLGPDLTITKVYLLKEVYEGDSAMIYIEVSNIGVTEASGFTVTLSIFEDVYESGVIALGAGEKMNVTYHYTFPSPGIYTFEAIVDPWNIVHESNEENNTKVFNINVKEKLLPDLAVSYLKVYYSVVTNEITHMYLEKADITVKNFGLGDTPQDKLIELVFFLDSPENIIATYTYEGYLRSGEQFNYTYNFNKLPISYGQHTLGVIVDYQDIIAESNENNNVTQVVFPEQIPGAQVH
ncbi:MAG: hypothetical protein KAT49_05300 [Methanomicrobia archaeon]|nr:hypothetical protein [Methanomicrobia archaeon]